MLRKGCWRLRAQLSFLHRSFQVSKSGHRNLVSCIDRKASPRVQVLGTRAGAVVPTLPGRAVTLGRSALPSPPACLSPGRSSSALFAMPASHPQAVGTVVTPGSSFHPVYLGSLLGRPLSDLCCASGPRLLLPHPQTRLVKRVLQAFHWFLSPFHPSAHRTRREELESFSPEMCPLSQRALCG